MREQARIRRDGIRSWLTGKEPPAGVAGNRKAAVARLSGTANFARTGRIAFPIAVCVAGFLLFTVVMLAIPAASSAEVAVGISVTFAPPALPVYVQPPCPSPGYIWTPGYWAWDPEIGYYWVPGTWVLAPFPGALWTPGYWGWSNGLFVWYPGYWGTVVGFYGGINYGFGYTGYGYHGGYWSHGAFYYNRAVTNVNVTNITNVYNQTVTGAVTRTRVSYNGGPGGIAVRPTASQQAAARERHSAPTDVQRQHERTAGLDPKQRAAENHGRPAVAATTKPGVTTGPGVVRASRAGAPYKAPQGGTGGTNAPARTTHPTSTERQPRVSGPEHASPPPHASHPVAPRNEPQRPAYRPAETHPAPEHSGVTHQPNTYHAAPPHPETPRSPTENRHEEGGQH